MGYRCVVLSEGHPIFFSSQLWLGTKTPGGPQQLQAFEYGVSGDQRLLHGDSAVRVGLLTPLCKESLTRGPPCGSHPPQSSPSPAS